MTTWNAQRVYRVLVIGLAYGGAAALPAKASDESGNPPNLTTAQAPAPAPISPPTPAPNVAPEAAPAAAPKPPAAGTPAVVMDVVDAETIMGRSVRSSAGEDMGRIVDIVVTNTGTIRAAIIDFGGFLGVGTRKIAVDWHAIQFTRSGKTMVITAALTKSQVQISPEYKAGEPFVILGSKPSEPVEQPAPEAAPQVQAVPAPAPDQDTVPRADNAVPQAPK